MDSKSTIPAAYTLTIQSVPSTVPAEIRLRRLLKLLLRGGFDFRCVDVREIPDATAVAPSERELTYTKDDTHAQT